MSAEDARILISLGKARGYVEPELPPIDPDLIPDESQGQGAALLGAPRMHGIAGLTTESAAALVVKPRKKQ